MKISVIIPVKNGGGTLARCLKSIRDQTVSSVTEIIILDSESTDNSREIAESFDARVINIPARTFNHGLTRNVGVGDATGALVFLTVQDAWLAETDMLEKMAGHFNDTEVMGVVGHQAVPHEKDKNPMQWFRRFSEPKVIVRQFRNTEEFKKIPVNKLAEYIAWDDVVAMYRKSAMTALPFVETESTEDWIWSNAALQQGWKLIYDPSLVVYHYHHQTFGYSFRVTYSINYQLYKWFGIEPVNTQWLRKIGRSLYHLSKNKELSIRERIYWAVHNINLQLGNFLSTMHFRVTLALRGKKGIEKAHFAFCNKVPQGQQK